ncbi:alginate lyase family protein [Galbibacter sp.]|uniref:alginate lyase family protein n=1 Tax=Galbibacter sp. TaxID=2918471 RepID=UPI003A95848F
MKNYIALILVLLTVLEVKAQAMDVMGKLDFDNPRLKQVKMWHDSGNVKEAKKTLLKYYREKENLYLSVDKNDIVYIRNNFPEKVASSIRVADQVRRKYFLFRYEWDMEKTIVPYTFTKEIDWHLNPFGDPEWTFMLNRHRFWIDLGKAYMLTGKEKYAKEFVDQVTHWIVNNPITDETKRTSWRRIEAGIRIENWVKSFEYVKHSKYVTPDFLEMFLSSMVEHAAYIDSGFNRHSQISNWGVLEFNGLFTAAVFLSEFKQSEEWKKSAIEKLDTCIRNQILDDGTQWEQSPMYHNEVMHCYLNVVLLSKRARIELPRSILDRTLQMAYANVAWQKPNYNEPLLGDSDDNDLRGLLTMAAILSKDELLKFRAYDQLDYENYFLFGDTSNQSYQQLPMKQPDFLSAYQFNAGDLYSRSSWEEDAFYSSFHMRRIGGGHSHDDLLHFTLFAYGKDYLVDGGRYTYVGSSEWRKYFKSNTAHNTLGVDGLTNSVYSGSWSNSFEAKSEGAYVVIEDDFDYAEVFNKAYLRLDDPVLIKRRVLYLKPDIWLLIDSFEAENEHQYSQYFNFADKRVKIQEGGLTTTFDTNNLRIQPFKEAGITLIDAWYSPDYNYKEEITRAELSKKATGFHSFITLLYFPENNKVEFENIPILNRNGRKLADNEAEAVRLKVNEKEYILLVSHDIANRLSTHKIVDDQIVTGEVVLIERVDGEQKIKVLK